jgi:secreted trypsin-like serine protease
VKLKNPAKGKVIPLSAKGHSVPVGQPLEVTGWGITEKGETSDRLCKTTVPYIDTAKCNQPESYGGGIRPGMLCAGYLKGEKKDSCGGDSGGPLVWRSPDGPILIGVVSFGEECAKDNKPGVYTRVSSYRDWIEQVLGADQN